MCAICIHIFRNGCTISHMSCSHPNDKHTEILDPISFRRFFSLSFRLLLARWAIFLDMLKLAMKRNIFQKITVHAWKEWKIPECAHCQTVTIKWKMVANWQQREQKYRINGEGKKSNQTQITDKFDSFSFFNYGCVCIFFLSLSRFAVDAFARWSSETIVFRLIGLDNVFIWVRLWMCGWTLAIIKISTTFYNIKSTVSL